MSVASLLSAFQQNRFSESQLNIVAMNKVTPSKRMRSQQSGVKPCGGWYIEAIYI